MRAVLFLLPVLALTGCTMSGDPNNSGLFYSPQLAARERSVMQQDLQQARNYNRSLQNQYASTRSREKQTYSRLNQYRKELAGAKRDLRKLKATQQKLGQYNRTQDQRINTLERKIAEIDANPASNSNLDRLIEIRQDLQREVRQQERQNNRLDF